MHSSPPTVCLLHDYMKCRLVLFTKSLLDFTLPFVLYKPFLQFLVMLTVFFELFQNQCIIHVFPTAVQANVFASVGERLPFFQLAILYQMTNQVWECDKFCHSHFHLTVHTFSISSEETFVRCMCLKKQNSRISMYVYLQYIEFGKWFVAIITQNLNSSQG